MNVDIKVVLFASIVCTMVLFIIFLILSLSNNKSIVFISKKEKFKLINIINDETSKVRKTEWLQSMYTKNGAVQNKKIYNILLKIQNETELDTKKFSELVNYFESNMYCNDEVDSAIKKITDCLNNNNNNEAKIELEKLKKGLKEQRRKEGFDIWYDRILSIILAILTIISFVYGFY